MKSKRSSSRSAQLGPPGQQNSGQAGQQPGGDVGREPSGNAVLLVSDDDALRDEVALIAAVVGLRLETAARWPDLESQRRWVVVLCSPDNLPPTARQGQGVLLLSHDAEALWEAAATMPGMRPVPLPQAEQWLSRRLSAEAFDRSHGKVVAVASSAGGAGATTFAYLAAAELAARGTRPLLIDAAAESGSGIADLVQQARSQQQLRGGNLDWDQLNRTRGEISTSHLSAAVPELEGFGVLTGTSTAARSTPLLPAAVSAGREAFDTVIIDTGQGCSAVADLGEQLAGLLVVTRASRRGAAATQLLLDRMISVDAAVAVNRRSAPGWDAQQMAHQLTAPVVTDCAEQKWLARSDELGEAYELLRTKGGAAMVAAALDALGVGDA